MNDAKFVDYKETPGEKSLGIVTVMYTGTVQLRYKMNPGKNGGSYPNPPSFKIGEEYVSAIIPESNIGAENIKECIKEGMKKQSSMPSNPYRSASSSDDSQVPF